MDIKFSHHKPLLYEFLKKKFKSCNWEAGVIITIGNTIYSKNPISKDEEVHETVHVRQQQSYGVTKWWDEYVANKDFRLSQEIEAYKAQALFINENGNRKDRRFKIPRIAELLSSDLYGNLISYDEAFELLK